MFSTAMRVARIGLLALCLGAPSSAAPQTWKELDKQGTAAERAGQYEAALQLYAKAINQLRGREFMDPSNGDLRHLFGDVLRTAGLMKHPPQISEMSARSARVGLDTMRRAETPEDAAAAVGLLHFALVEAPWSTSIVYDLALAYELLAFSSANHYGTAAAYFEIYLFSRPPDTPAVRQRITELQEQQGAAALAEAEDDCLTRRNWRSCQMAAGGNRRLGNLDRARLFGDVACRLENLAIMQQGGRPNEDCR